MGATGEIAPVVRSTRTTPLGPWNPLGTRAYIVFDSESNWICPSGAFTWVSPISAWLWLLIVRISKIISAARRYGEWPRRR